MKDKRFVTIILGLLVLQFVLGMLANLYATIPHSKPYEVFDQFGYIMFHALNGTLLVVLSIVFTIKNRKLPSFKSAIGGLISILLAFTFGELFVFTQQNIFSLLMALSFISAFLSYSRIVFSNPITRK